LAKAKALRVHAEPLITKSKDDTTHNRRVVFSYLQNKEAIKELFGVVREKIADRPGGYLRIIKIGHRKSDGAEMAMIEFVDFNEVYSLDGSGKTAKKSRRRRGSSGKGKSTDTAVATETIVDDVAETVIEDYPVDEPDAADEATEESKEENQ
jgi:large subunit ribosomal protein L17